MTDVLSLSFLECPLNLLPTSLAIQPFEREHYVTNLLTKQCRWHDELSFSGWRSFEPSPEYSFVVAFSLSQVVDTGPV